MLAAKILLMANKGAFYEQLQVPYRPKKRAFNSWFVGLLRGFYFMINEDFKGLLIRY